MLTVKAKATIGPVTSIDLGTSTGDDDDDEVIVNAACCRNYILYVQGGVLSPSSLQELHRRNLITSFLCSVMVLTYTPGANTYTYSNVAGEGRGRMPHHRDQRLFR